MNPDTPPYRQDQAKLRRINRALRVLSKTNKAQFHSDTESDLLDAVCRVAIEEGGYRMAWVGVAEQNEEKRVRPVAQRGFDAAYLANLTLTWDNTDLGRGPTGVAIRTGEPHTARHIVDDPDFTPWREAAIERGYASSIALPLIIDDDVWGALNIYAAEAGAFHAEEVELLQELAADLAYGIKSLRSQVERKRIETALRESEEKYRLLAENATDLISKHTLEGVYTFASPSSREVLGYAPDELVGRSAYDLILPDSANAVRDAHRRVLAGADAVTVAFQIRHKNGHVIWVESTNRLLQATEVGAPREIIAVTRDVTARKEAEEALRAREARHHAIMENFPNGMVALYDHDLRYIIADGQGLAQIGMSGADLVGKRLRDVFPPQIYERDEPALRAALRGETTESIVSFGDQVYRVTTLPVRNDQGQIINGLVMSQNVTSLKEAELALQNTLEELQLAIDTAHLGVWRLDLESDRLHWNDQLLNIYGLTRAEFERDVNGWRRQIHPDDYAAANERLSSVKTGKSVYDVAYRIIRPDGEIRHISASASPTYNEAGDMAGMIGVNIDVTPIKKHEEALRESEEKFRSIIEQSHDGIALMDEKGVVVAWNPALERITGIPQQEAIGQFVWDVRVRALPEEERNEARRHRIRAALEDALAGEQTPWVNALQERTFQHSDGAMKTTEEVAFPIRTEKGMMLGTIIRDITERKQALLVAQEQRALADALANTAAAVNQTLQFDVVLQHILEGVHDIVPHDGAVITLLNEERRRVYVAQFCACYEQGALPAPSLNTAVPLDDNPYLQQMMATRKPLLIDDAAASPLWPAGDSATPTASYLGTPILIDGAVIGFLSVVSADPGFFRPKHQKHLQALAHQAAVAIRNAHLHESVQTQLRQLREAQIRLVQSEKLAAIGELVSGIAHELNNPLASLVLYAQLLRTQPLDPAIKEDINQIVTQAKRASDIVRRLLDFARQRPVQREPVQLNDLLRSTISLMGYELRTHNIRVEFDLEPDLPLIVGDAQQLQQVFVNLLNNAMQAQRGNSDAWVGVTSEMGPPQFQQNEKTDNVARLVVRDNGPGMTLEVQKRIFDPFFTTKEPGQGTGLGLAVCHGIVGEHDGHIWVKSEIGQGTSFFLEFPAATAVSLPTPSPSPAPAPPSPHHLPRILVVDDEESILRVISRILGERYEVDTVTNGRVALEKVEAEQYDLIICDVHMPGLNGIDFYETWRRRRPAQAQAVPILFITGDTVNHQTREKLASIAAPALAKPFAADALLAQTHALIAGAKRRKRS